MRSAFRVIALAASVLCVPAMAQDLPASTSSGFRFAANTRILEPVLDPRPLPVQAAASGADLEYVATAKKLMGAGSTRAAVLTRKGEILFEDYSFEVSAESTPLGYSISKGLVSLAVGKALCDGSITSLSDKAETYVPALAGTSYGASTIRQLLLMMSGAYVSDPATGQVGPNESYLLRNMYEPRGLDVNLLERLKANTGAAKPGIAFSYKNYDTQALVYVVEGATRTDFASYFDRTVWRPARPEHSGAWLRSKDNEVIGFAGFSAAPRDFVRIGYWVLDEMKANKKGCFAKYLADATQAVLPDTPSKGRAYGYQLHKLSLRLAPASFWFVGYGGQFLGVDPVSEQVVYLYQANEKQAVNWVMLTASFMGKQ